MDKSTLEWSFCLCVLLKLEEIIYTHNTDHEKTDILSHWAHVIEGGGVRLRASCHVICLLQNQGLNPIKWDEHVQVLEQNKQAREKKNQLPTELIKSRLRLTDFTSSEMDLLVN